MMWQTAGFRLDLTRPHVMGIVNVTPDSFSDGGAHADAASALRHGEQLLAQGADILDIGGESTRPGALPLPLAQELQRVLPVVQEAVKWGVPVSVDTYKPEVMRAVLDAGAAIINDVWALRWPGAVDAVAAHPSCGLCLMHMHREPQTMQAAPMTGDVVAQVRDFLHQRLSALQVAGVARERVVLDAGIGFGKTPAQNFALLAAQPALLELGLPWLAAWSRKSSLGVVTGRSAAHERVAASVAAAVLAVDKGARVLRVHDVRETVDALKVWAAAQT